MRAGTYGKASIAPDVAHAGEKGEWVITYTVGKAGIKEGGGIRIITPRLGMDRWFLGKVVACCDNPKASLEVLTEKTWPVTYHHSNYPAVTVVVYGTDLKPGETIRVVVGALGGYVSGRFIQTQAQSHASAAPFQVFVDPRGNARVSRERARFGHYYEVPGALTVGVNPGRAAQIRCTIRSSPGKRRDLVGVLAVEDRYENPITDQAFDVSLFVEQGDLRIPLRVRKPRNWLGAKFTVKAVCDETSRIGASCWQNGIYGVSNPVHEGFPETGYNIYFGDTHVMTGSHGSAFMDGTTEGALQYARDVFGLDFTAVTNTLDPQCWPADRELFKAYNKEYQFVTIPAYENSLATGHKNVYFLREPRTVRRAATAAELWKIAAGKECMVISHHPNCASETDPVEQWGPLKISTINPKYERLIEICQNRGSFERDEVGEEVSFGGYGSSTRDVLAKGFRLGFVGGTDTHRGRPGSPLSNQSGLDACEHVTGGITGVLCKELTRRAIWDALLARRCYATTSVRTLLDVRVNGLRMGQDVKLTKANRERFAVRRITVKAAGTRPIDRVVIVRNGREVHEKRINAIECSVGWQDRKRLADVHDAGIRGIYYYAKVYQQDKNMAFSSPIWLTYRA